MDSGPEKARAERRSRTLKEGLVSFNRKSSGFPCQVRDLSRSGAKLQFDDPPALPSSFYLHIPIDGEAYPAEVRWTRGLTIGVRFTGPAEPSHVRRSQVLAPAPPALEASPPKAAAVRTEAEPGDLRRPRPKPTFGRLK